jgi:hypothetical protein
MLRNTRTILEAPNCRREAFVRPAASTTLYDFLTAVAIVIKSQ